MDASRFPKAEIEPQICQSAKALIHPSRPVKASQRDHPEVKHTTSSVQCLSGYL